MCGELIMPKTQNPTSYTEQLFRPLLAPTDPLAGTPCGVGIGTLCGARIGTLCGAGIEAPCGAGPGHLAGRGLGHLAGRGSGQVIAPLGLRPPPPMPLR